MSGASGREIDVLIFVFSKLRLSREVQRLFHWGAFVIGLCHSGNAAFRCLERSGAFGHFEIVSNFLFRPTRRTRFRGSDISNWLRPSRTMICLSALLIQHLVKVFTSNVAARRE